MSNNTRITSSNQLPYLPETQIIEPLVQCGVLYLGTAPPSPGLRGLDSVQEPFSHRYPVDGTNTVRGIDSILSVYDNGIQFAFARQPHSVIFFPLSSLIYCASLRFSIVENDQMSSIDWRFITLDPEENIHYKHPPLFCAVVQRTQILPGDECHCFITKDDDAALALVRTISEVYANLKPNTKPHKSPIFYQLDRYGRKISELNGTIYLSPATDDDSKLNPMTDHHSSVPIIDRNYLLNPSSDGFFYRTDANIIEQWQLWDDNDVRGSRPHPPPSPFGQHQGLYHDDLTHEIHHHLRHMDDEEQSNSSSDSSSCTRYHRHRHSRQNPIFNGNQFNASFSHSQRSLNNPSLSSLLQNNMMINRSQQAPIIIEKVVPNLMPIAREQSPKYMLQTPSQPQQPLQSTIPTQQTDTSYAEYSDAYEVNERGEKFTKSGNRILFMDAIQPNTHNNEIISEPYITSKSRSRSRRHRSKRIPIIDLRSIESFINNHKISRSRRTSSYNNEEQLQDHHSATSNLLEIVDGYFEDYDGRKMQLNADDTQAMLEQFESLDKIRHRQKKESRHRNHSVLTVGPSINYVERSSITSESQHEHQTPEGTIQSIEPSIHQPETELLNDNNNITSTPNPDFLAAFRYMQSSINPLLLREYRNTFPGQ